ncbi:hypothetical protein [Herminiimonas contaminans]|uniref:Uncharacterized protein n=1 Tax=Herminiimonas contaminans TaxID=1111140 RepID=A0ABS0EY72_9BURK|nr:hypothetical protein [Herminiimonas contaminans]MBF8179811.1 hypothetical protein [Herminiimonas contaminans]
MNVSYRPKADISAHAEICKLDNGFVRLKKKPHEEAIHLNQFNLVRISTCVTGP